VKNRVQVTKEESIYSGVEVKCKEFIYYLICTDEKVDVLWSSGEVKSMDVPSKYKWISLKNILIVLGLLR
jgi:hypothetical protein